MAIQLTRALAQGRSSVSPTAFSTAIPNPAKAYEQRSDTSLKRVTLNFLRQVRYYRVLVLERFPEVLRLCGGSFDDPDWFERTPGKCRRNFMPAPL